MKKTFCLLNHELTDNQIKELKEQFCSDEIIYPSEELSDKWGQIPAVSEIDHDTINSVIDWLKNAGENDLFIVQGEAGSTFMIVDYALKNGLIPLHAVTKREETEVSDGEKIIKRHIFEHVCFRQYKYFD